MVTDAPDEGVELAREAVSELFRILNEQLAVYLEKTQATHVRFGSDRERFVAMTPLLATQPRWQLAYADSVRDAALSVEELDGPVLLPGEEREYRLSRTPSEVNLANLWSPKAGRDGCRKAVWIRSRVLALATGFSIAFSGCSTTHRNGPAATSRGAGLDGSPATNGP